MERDILRKASRILFSETKVKFDFIRQYKSVIRTAKRWLYLTTVIDIFDRKVIGWALSSSTTARNNSICPFRMTLANRTIINNAPLLSAPTGGFNMLVGNLFVK